MADQRKFERYKINVPVKIQFLSQEEMAELYIGTANLSAEGVLLLSQIPVVEGSRVEMEIFLEFEELISDSDPKGILVISTTGHVLRSGHEGTAIHFTGDDYALQIGGELIAKEIPYHRG